MGPRNSSYLKHLCSNIFSHFLGNILLGSGIICESLILVNHDISRKMHSFGKFLQARTLLKRSIHTHELLVVVKLNLNIYYFTSLIFNFGAYKLYYIGILIAISLRGAAVALHHKKKKTYLVVSNEAGPETSTCVFFSNKIY